MAGIASTRKIKVGGNIFYSGYDGIKKDLLKIIKEGERIYQITDPRNYFGIVKEKEGVNLINENHALHEMLHTYPRRVYFDIDVDKAKVGDCFDCFNIFNFLHSIRIHISNDEANVYGYSTDTKKSYHIILSDTYFECADDINKFKEYMNYLKKCMPKEFDPYLDTSVYKDGQIMKMINQSKKDAPAGRVQTIVKGCPIRDIKNTFICSYIGTERKPLFGNCGNKSEYDNFSVSGSIPVQLQAPVVIKSLKMPIISREEIETAKGLLKLCPVVSCDDEDFDRIHRLKVLSFCYWNNITFDEFTEWFNNQDTSKFNFQQRLSKCKIIYEQQKNREQYRQSINTFKKYLGEFYPDLATDDDFQTSRFLSSFNILSGDKSKYTRVKTIETKFVEHTIFDELDTERQIYILALCMGGGKTTATLKYLKENPRKSFIWFAPRQTLVLNISQRMTTEFSIKHTNHLSVGSNKKKLREADNVLICNQSLHYLDYNKKYDFVVIDEIESVLNSWSDSTTHGDNMNDNFIQFTRILQQAKKIILLDAFITTKTFNFLKSLLKYKKDECLTVVSAIIPPSKILIQNNDYTNVIHKIADEIRAGKKLYIFYAYKTGKNQRDGINDLDYHIKRRIQELDKADAKTDSEKLKIMEVDTKCYKQSLVYYAESKEKNDLGNVNELWAQSDYIITNTSITVGVNYEGDDYDKIYLLVSGTTGSPRDIIQTSMRIRNTKENTIEMFFFDVMNKDFLDYPKLYSETDNQVFKNLIIDIYAEYHSNFVESFKKFCDLTSYDYSNVPVLKKKQKVKGMDNYINDLYESNSLLEYTKVRDLNDDDLEYLQRKVIERKATMSERLAVDKYFFKIKFGYLCLDSRKFIWNFQGRNFIKGMEHEIIESVKKDNNITILEDLDFKKLNVSDHTFNLIKTKYSFTFDNKNKKLLIKKVIDSILGVKAIESKRVGKDKRAEGDYTFSDLFNTLNNIFKEHLVVKEKEAEEARLYDEQMANTEFIDDADEVQTEYDKHSHLPLDDTNPHYSQFLKLKQAKKPIPDELKMYDLDI